MDEPERHEYTAALRISSERLNLAEVEARLGKGTDGRDIGDPVMPRRPDGPRRRQTHWSMNSAIARTRPLDEHIDELVTFAESHRESLESLQADCQIDIFCGVFSGVGQGGFAIEPSLSRRLGDLKLAVEFDIY